MRSPFTRTITEGLAVTIDSDSGNIHVMLQANRKEHGIDRLLLPTDLFCAFSDGYGRELEAWLEGGVFVELRRSSEDPRYANLRVKMNPDGNLVIERALDIRCFERIVKAIDDLELMMDAFEELGHDDSDGLYNDLHSSVTASQSLRHRNRAA